MPLIVVRRKDIPRRGDMFIKLSAHGLYFTVSSCNWLNLKTGDCITFLNEDKHWEMAKTADQEQFRLVKNSGAGLWIMNTGLSKMMKKSMSLVQPNRILYIRKTGRMLNGHELVILSLTKPL